MVQTKSLLLKCIVHFFGVLGNQLTPLFPINWLGIAHLIINTTLSLVIIHYIVHRDVLLFRPLVASLLLEKPLLSLLVKTFLQFGELSMIITNQLYSLLYGPEVIRTLGSPIFDSVPAFQNKTFTVKIIVVFLFINQVVYVISFILQLINQWAWPPTFDSIVANLVLFSVGANHYFYFHLVLYLEYGTLEVLKGLEIEVKEIQKSENSHINVLASVYSQIRSLALTHDRLLSLIAFPFSYLVLIMFVGTVNCTCLYGMYFDGSLGHLMFFFYPSVIWSYFVSIMVINGQNLTIFDRLSKALQSQRKLPFVKNVTKPETAKTLSNSQTMSYFDFQEQYRHCFQLRLYRLINVDLKFVFAAFILGLGFVVFIVQTA